MDNTLKAGLTGTKEIVVTPKDTALAHGSGQVDVYATPAMIALMENTADSSLQGHLPQGYLTVGFEVNIRHLKASPVGSRVWAESVLESVEGKKLSFRVKAWDQQGEIGSGTHTRYIVKAQKFLKEMP